MPPTLESVRRRWLEGASWAGLIALLWGLDTLAKLEDRRRTGVGLDDFRLLTEQATSAAAALVMVLFVATWLHRFPLDRQHLVRSVAGHALGSLLFASGHYALMVVLRIATFHVNGMEYLWRHDHRANLLFEYQKDLKIYLGMVAVIALYRQLRRRRAVRMAAPATGGEHAVRMLVQTGSGETLVNVADVDYLQAARNYVSVHADGREYLLRDTISNLELRLAAGGFLRTHRSFLVNVARIAEIRPAETGAWEIRLHGGARLPLSRGYRDAVRAALRRAAGS